MTKRLSAGVLLVATVVLMTALTAYAERPDGREWVSKGIQNPMVNHDLPLFFRSRAGTTWVRVHQTGLSPCDSADTANSNPGQSIEHIWCFEGANGDSTWPANAAGEPDALGEGTWGHWSKFDPPLPPVSKWHTTTRHAISAGNWNAWAGCDSIVGVTGSDNNDDACTDTPFWIYQEGYGDDWNYALRIEAPNANPAGTATIEFDVRYDVECLYDYLYLEYKDNVTQLWFIVEDGLGTPAVFNGVSGTVGPACEDDYFGYDTAGATAHGNSIWVSDVVFPLPNILTGGIEVRWRAESDGAWSDADGSGDTDGIGAIDNVLLSWGGGAHTVSDAFGNTSFDNLTGGGDATMVKTGGETVNARWWTDGLVGNTFDSWHLEFDPTYKNKGNTCTFSDDWMWAAKPAAGWPSNGDANGMSMYLVSPKFDVDGWTGGILEYSGYMCMVDGREDYSNTHFRTYNAALSSWSLWSDFDGFIIFAGCEFWNFNDFEELTPHLGANVDSLQLAWEVLDVSQPGTFQWNRHGSTAYVIDNVSVGSFDGNATVFTARGIDIYADTFSLSDPAHTPFLQNAEQGIWSGIAGGTRDFASPDSMTWLITDTQGITASNVKLWWRTDNGTPVDTLQTWGAWNNKTMDLSLPLPLSTSDEGTYRAIIGADNGTVEDMTGAADGRIWVAGTTVQYYVKVTDDATNDATWPAGATPEVGADPVYAEFSILPFDLTTPQEGHKILLVDDFTRNMVDFENSTGFFDPDGDIMGNFVNPVFDAPEDMVERALAYLYLPDDVDGELNPAWDKYDVQGGGSSVQCEPRGTASSSQGLGAYRTAGGLPYYDAIIWLQGNFANYCFADTTRLELGAYIEAGGNLMTTGDDIANFLGTGGSNADSTIGFIRQYLGCDFASTDDATTNRILNVTGVAGGSMAGVTLGLYGECPLRRSFDRLTPFPGVPGSIATELLQYADGAVDDNGRTAAMKNVRQANNGCAVLTAFDVSAFLSDRNRAHFIHNVFEQDFGLAITKNPDFEWSGVDAPQIANGIGFRLAKATPNPFSSSTSIEFSIANRSHVSIEVYNILGQKVRTLVDEHMEADSYVRQWDGRADDGSPVSSGIYFYKMVAGDYSDTQKAVLLK